VKNIANDWKPFGAWWKSTEGLLSESDYEPEDEANEGNRNEVSHEATAITRNPHGTGDSNVMLSAHTDEGGSRLPVIGHQQTHFIVPVIWVGIMNVGKCFDVSVKHTVNPLPNLDEFQL
jgi:hypothetical protein